MGFPREAGEGTADYYNALRRSGDIYQQLRAEGVNEETAREMAHSMAMAELDELRNEKAKDKPSTTPKV